MNEYGQAALEHWEKWLPSRLSLIPQSERTTYFTQLGEQVQNQIAAVEESLETQAGEELKSLGYLERVGRLTAIRSQARELVLGEMVYLEPEATPAREANLDSLDLDETDDPLSEWMDPMGMPRDRTHPLWAMQEDETVSTEEFAKAAREWEDGLWAQLRSRQSQQNPPATQTPTTSQTPDPQHR